MARLDPLAAGGLCLAREDAPAARRAQDHDDMTEGNDMLLHPRPRFTRERWTDLSGPWQFTYDDADGARSRSTRRQLVLGSAPFRA
jgi:hypothetical protein